MKKVITIIFIMFSFFSNANSNYEKLAHEFSFNSIYVALGNTVEKHNFATQKYLNSAKLNKI